MREKGRKKRLVCYIVPIFCVGRSWDFLPTYVVWFIDSITNQLGTSLLLQHTHTHTSNTNTNVENSLKEFNWFVTSLQLHFINNNYTYKFAYIQPARSSFLKITYVRGEYSVGIYGNGMNTTTNVQFFPLSHVWIKNVCFTFPRYMNCAPDIKQSWTEKHVQVF